LGPAIWPPIEERTLDFTGVLVELLPLLGEEVRVEVGSGREHSRAVLCGSLTPIGDATGGYAGFVIGDAALTLKESEFAGGAVSVMADAEGDELRTVYILTEAGTTISIARDVLVRAAGI
jgi:hypothetical protein